MAMDPGRHLRALLAPRGWGIAAVAAMFAFQSLQAIGCGHDAFALWRITAMLVVPAVLLLAMPVSAGTVVAIVVLLPFVALSNAIECAPVVRTDAAMGYVLSFLFGMPASLLAGLAAGIWSWRRRRRRTAVSPGGGDAG